jgi:hypothetical protein
MHNACQHTGENEDSCVCCKFARVINYPKRGNMKSDFGGFMNNVSHIDLTGASVLSLVEFGKGMNGDHIIKEKAA